MGQEGVVRDQDAESVARDRRTSPRDDFDEFLGEYPELICLRTLLPAERLAAAAQRARELGIGADRVLVANGAIGDDVYLHRFSMRAGIRIADLSAVSRADLDLRDDDLQHAARTGMLQIRIGGKPMLVMSLRCNRARNVMQMARSSPRETGRLRLVSDHALQDFLLNRPSGLISDAVDGLQTRFPALSAAPRPRGRWYAAALRRIGIGALLLGLSAAVMIFPATIGKLLALVFLAAIGIRLTASLLKVTPANASPVPDHDLPLYSIIVALYREERSVGPLIDALAALDYPREKLDIIFVVETDDDATRSAIARADPTSRIRVIVAPNQGPRTKPKALNVALPFARGRYVAVYDAEDIPDPDQPRRACAAFREGGDDLACVQARLAIDNSGDSLITRMFAAEYAAQFDIVMPGYERLGLPWPLGGTSNHFDAAKLREVCAWDPYNVTEDADLGLRFARFRYRTATLNSTTWEEAPIQFRPWLGQRTRWMKGWMRPR